MLFGEAAWIVLLTGAPTSTSTAAATTATTLTLPIVHVVRTYRQEVHIGRGRTWPAHDVVVGGLGVVRYLIARLQLQIFEHESVPGGHLAQRTRRSGEESDRALRTPVHRIGEFEADTP